MSYAENDGVDRFRVISFDNWHLCKATVALVALFLFAGQLAAPAKAQATGS